MDKKEAMAKLVELAKQNNLKIMIIDNEIWSEEMQHELLKAATRILINNGKIVLS